MKEWLDAVSTARIPCAVVSSLDRRNMVEALERMGLMKYFQVVYYILLEMMYTMWSAISMCMLLTVMLLMQAIVTEEDGMESIAHRFLSAAVKVRLKCILSVGPVHF